MGCAPSLPLGERWRRSSASLSEPPTPPTLATNHGETNCTNKINHLKTPSPTILLQAIENHADMLSDESRLQQRQYIITNSMAAGDQLVSSAATRQTPETLKIVTVFAADDATSDTWLAAATRLRCEAHPLRTGGSPPEDLMAEINQVQANVIIIDRRQSGAESNGATAATTAAAAAADSLCRLIRLHRAANRAIIVAVIKRSCMERDDSVISNLLHTGYDRCCVETVNVASCMNELLMLQATWLPWRNRQRLAEAALSVTDSSRELVTVADSQFNIVYVNHAVEKMLGYTTHDALGENLLRLYKSDGNHCANAVDISEAVSHVLTNKNREWEGTCFCRRKNGDSLPLYSRLFVHNSQTPNVESVEYVILLQEPHAMLIDKSMSGDVSAGDFYHLPRNSLYSARKASYDVRSIGSDGVIRKQSLARLHSMAIEAPITKVINILTAAQESTPMYISQALDKVLRILRSTELYAPQVSESKNRNEDPVTNDLVGALLMQGQRYASSNNRRSSSESTNKAVVHSQLISRGSLLPVNIFMPAQLKEILENDSQWDFDVIRLEKLTGKRPLVWLGMTIMSRFELPRTLNCDECTLQNWLSLVEANYHASNSYHNSTHAADVLQSTAYFLQKTRIKPLLDSLDEAACLIAATIHDMDHPGKTSGFLCNAGSDLAILYNDHSVLESHHVALAFKLTLQDDRVNIFKGLDRDNYKLLRQSIIDMVLATEMTKHFEHLSKFINIFAKHISKEDGDISEEIDYTNLATAENVTLVKNMLIKCADVSNPTRPLSLCVEWARRIAEEYFNQTAEEKMKGLPVVMPQFDRLTCSIPKSQIGFTDFFISDMFDAWDAFAEIPELMNHMKENYQFWKDQDAAGVTGIPAGYASSHPATPTDITPRKIQTLAEAKESFSE